MRSATTALWLFTLGAILPLSAFAQDDLDAGLLSRCAAPALPSERERTLCRDAAVAAQILQPEMGMALAGGNPVLGTASVLGARFRAIPRLNLGGRISFIFVDMPEITDYPPDVGEAIGTFGFTLPSAQLDLSVGLFEGLDMGPTLGGLGAVEIMGSLSALIYPADDGFTGDATGYGIGARIGLIRESFTAPGISFSVFRKWADGIQLGDVERGADARVGLDLRSWSLRAGISKSFVTLGIAITLGWDSYSSDVDLSLRDAGGTVITLASESDPVDLDSERWSAHLNLSYIVLFFNFVGEVGWQESETLTLSNGDEIESGNAFGAIGVRLTL